MTLFLLLVTIAAIIPFATVAMELRNLGTVGSLIGFCLAAVAGAGQFIGHHWVTYRLEGKLKDSWISELVVVAYYVAILGIGVLCAELTLCLARQLTSLIA